MDGSKWASIARFILQSRMAITTMDLLLSTFLLRVGLGGPRRPSLHKSRHPISSVGLPSVMKAYKHDWPEQESNEGFSSSVAARWAHVTESPVPLRGPIATA